MLDRDCPDDESIAGSPKRIDSTTSAPHRRPWKESRSDLAAGSAAIGRWEVSLELKVGSRGGPGEGCVTEGEHPAVCGHQPVPVLSRCDRDADDGGVEVRGAG